MFHQQGYTYVGLSRGTVHRIDHHGKVEQLYSSTNQRVADTGSLVAHKGRLFFIESTDNNSFEVLVLGLNDRKLLTSWTVPNYNFYGRQMSLINNEQLAVGDWKRKQEMSSEEYRFLTV